MAEYNEHDYLENDKDKLRDYAWFHGELGMYDEEIADCEKLITLDPADPYSYVGLGFAYDRSGQAEKAAECYRDAMKRFPDHHAAYTNMGNWFEKHEKRDDLARVCYEKALELDPTDYWSLNNIGHVLQKEGKWLEALFYYRNAYDQITEEGASEDGIRHICHNLAFAYYRCKQYKKAWYLFNLLVKGPTDNSCASKEFDCCSSYKTCIYSDFGCVNYRLGNYQDALKLFEKALSFCPRSRNFQRLSKVAMKKVEDSGKAQLN